MTGMGQVCMIGDIERAIVAECENEEAEMEVDYRTIQARLGFSGFSVMVHV